MANLVTYRVTESSRIPAESGALAAAAVVPIVAGALLVLLLPPRSPARGAALRLNIGWSGGVLAFLAGVRRGLSYRTQGGPRQSEILSSLVLFGSAFGALAARSARASLLLLASGYACTGLFDAQAARQGEAPPFFARVRPAQVVVPVASFVVMLARLGGQRR